MGWLEAARVCCPSEWALGAGALRDLVWDHLTGRGTAARDVDVVFFGGAHEGAVHDCLRGRRPDVPWEVADQALVHTWYERVFGCSVEPLVSVADGVGTWPETCTSVAVRLRDDGGLDVIAPCGLDDLFALVLRRNPRRVSADRFRIRLAEKRPDLRWPGVRVVED